MTKPAEPLMSWELTSHACRICFGRVLVRTTFENKKIYKCSNCDIEVEGSHEHALCCCGMKLRSNRDAGVRCQVNTNRTPENPAAVVAIQVDLKTATRT